LNWVDETVNLSTYGKQTYTYSVQSSATPLKITLVWTDYQGATISSKALVNDLDLKVTAPNGTIYYGNDFTSPFNTAYDRINNVENVFVNVPDTGTWTVEISGYNIPQGPQNFSLVVGGDFGTMGGSDTTAPTVSISAPTANAYVNGIATISANASDNVGVSRVDFYVDSILVGSDPSSPYSCSWDTMTFANSSHTLTAKAFDAATNMRTSATVAVTVSNSGNSVTEKFRNTISSDGTTYKNYYIDVTTPGTISLSLAWDNPAQRRLPLVRHKLEHIV
jgi:hypothetical protein